ncbi:MAG: cyclic nucleotide-binding domain-containing protein [Rhodospirillales bacterium]|nr:cyclic nucleotide-binding domain-containing protein [Rhodospirillales bacterium]MCW8862558.1 cyclic nucleotide-binding domain-containing protein [Rhodospirillales bacterium]MCW8951462.1 cyclic nucleotide-binding domain-containing protein [Rhodospirillales bacterium]MCW8970138.1 cyclic nucleotide-binding domain-containing protein [Rhodospirillales bacterium]MCW9001191.1 cyclic nucleotide-binding domain-containing protein [Rhodospirillales bacterium]
MAVQKPDDGWEGSSGEVAFAISRIAMFRGLTQEALEALLVGATIERHPRETSLFQPGDPANRFYILMEGRVELFVESSGRERESIIDFAGPWETFGLSAIFDRDAFPLGAKVIEDARMVVVPAKPFIEHLSEDFSAVRGMLAGMSAQLHMLIQQISDFKLKTTGQRLGGFLLGLANVNEGEAVVRLPYDKKMLANRLGMKPESLSRALGKLREIGVRGGGEELVIADVERLREFCEEGEII